MLSQKEKQRLALRMMLGDPIAAIKLMSVWVSETVEKACDDDNTPEYVRSECMSVAHKLEAVGEITARSAYGLGLLQNGITPVSAAIDVASRSLKEHDGDS